EEAAGAELDVLEACAVGADGAIVIDAAGHVGPVAAADFVVGGFFEIENAEGVFGVGDDVGALEGGGGESAERGDPGAGRHKAEEGTAIRRIRHHGGVFYRVGAGTQRQGTDMISPWQGQDHYEDHDSNETDRRGTGGGGPG